MSKEVNVINEQVLQEITKLVQCASTLDRFQGYEPGVGSILHTLQLTVLGRIQGLFDAID